MSTFIVFDLAFIFKVTSATWAEHLQAKNRGVKNDLWQDNMQVKFQIYFNWHLSKNVVFWGNLMEIINFLNILINSKFFIKHTLNSKEVLIPGESKPNKSLRIRAAFWFTLTPSPQLVTGIFLSIIIWISHFSS